MVLPTDINFMGAWLCNRPVSDKSKSLCRGNSIPMLMCQYSRHILMILRTLDTINDNPGFENCMIECFSRMTFKSLKKLNFYSSMEFVTPRCRSYRFRS